MDRDRLERPDQPHELRRARVPEALRLQPREGHRADARRPSEGARGRLERDAREGRARRLPAARARPVGDHAPGLMFGRQRSRVQARHGRYVLRLDERERTLIRQLLDELRELLALSPDDPRVRRLYPAAYADDELEDE